MRYAVVVGDDPDTGALICGPPDASGFLKPILYTDMRDACEAAGLCVKGGTVPNAFVMKLVPAAFYMGVVRMDDNTVYADETILQTEETDADLAS